MKQYNEDNIKQLFNEIEVHGLETTEYLHDYDFSKLEDYAIEMNKMIQGAYDKMTDYTATYEPDKEGDNLPPEEFFNDIKKGIFEYISEHLKMPKDEWLEKNK